MAGMAAFPSLASAATIENVSLRTTPTGTLVDSLAAPPGSVAFESRLSHG
jgi:hypothetical protein